MGNSKSRTQVHETFSSTNGEDSKEILPDIITENTVQKHDNHEQATSDTYALVMQNFRLIWIDSHIDESTADFKSSFKLLREVVDSVDTCLDLDECIRLLREIKQEQLLMIIEGSLGMFIVPIIHDNKCVHSIYVLHHDKDLNATWTKSWPKVRGVHTTIRSVCDTLRRDTERWDQNGIPMSFSDIDSSFMYTQLIKEALLQIDDANNEKMILQLVAYCRSQPNIRASDIKAIELSYHDHTPVCWYTGPYFIHSMLNRALRELDIDTILVMGFFIRQLHEQIKTLHRQQQFSNEPFNVYRGQALSLIDFNKLKKTEHGLISFNSFLSTSTDKNIARIYAENAASDSDKVGILFVMRIDPTLTNLTPFASLDRHSYYKQDEEEILFTTHTIFRVNNIKLAENATSNVIWIVNLILTTEDDYELRELTSNIREELGEAEGWDRIGRILIRTGESVKAKQLYETLLKSAPDHASRALYSNRLGVVHYEMGKYSTALLFYQQALELRQQMVPENHLSHATLYNNIGMVYLNLEQYEIAFYYFEKSHHIKELFLPNDDPQLAKSYNNMGLAYRKQKRYSQAILFYEKALDIRQKTLPKDHPDLATLYNNIGMVYMCDKEHSKALIFYKKALSIREKTLPRHHSAIAVSHNNIAGVYMNMEDYSTALMYYKAALSRQEKTLHKYHPDLAASYNNIAGAYYKMEKYEEALWFYEMALEIFLENLPQDHPLVIDVGQDIDLVKKRLSQSDHD